MVLLITNDDALAGTLGEKILRWGMELVRKQAIEDASQVFGAVSIVLLDVRAGGREVIEQFKALGIKTGGPNIVLLNRPDNITVSMAGMHAGATDELTEPFCAETLKQKILEADLMQSKNKRSRRSIFEAFSAAMSAAAMAHGGEFETALELYEDYDRAPVKDRSGKAGKTQPEDQDG